jgi:cell shape-determining protein MreC
MSEIESLRQEIEKLKERNKRVETNKAWETSFTRKLSLALLTYAVVGITLISMQNPEPWKNAIIPSIGFVLSTLSLPYIKTFWEQYIHKT